MVIENCKPVCVMSYEARLSTSGQLIKPAAFLRRGQLVTLTGNQILVFNCVEWNTFSMILSPHEEDLLVQPPSNCQTLNINMHCFF